MLHNCLLSASVAPNAILLLLWLLGWQQGEHNNVTNFSIPHSILRLFVHSQVNSGAFCWMNFTLFIYSFRNFNLRYEMCNKNALQIANEDATNNNKVICSVLWKFFSWSFIPVKIASLLPANWMVILDCSGMNA